MNNLPDETDTSTNTTKSSIFVGMIAVLSLVVGAALAIAVTYTGVQNFSDYSPKPTPAKAAELEVADNDYRNVYKQIAKLQIDQGGVLYAESAMEKGALSTQAAPRAGEGAGDESSSDGAAMRSTTEAAQDIATSNDTASAGTDVTTTNLAVAGIDEADIVKTDGNYIYVIANEMVSVVATGTGKPKLITTIGTDSSSDKDEAAKMARTAPGAMEAFLQGGRLIVVRNNWNYGVPMEKMASSADIAMSSVPAGSSSVQVDIYDVSDPANAKLVNTYGQSGYYVSSRMNGGKIYLVTNFDAPWENDKDKPETYVPSTNVGEATPKAMIARDVCIMPYVDTPTYTVVTSFDCTGEGKLIDQKSFLGSTSAMYQNSSIMLLASTRYVEEGDQAFEGTDLTQVKLGENGSIDVGAQGFVKGSPLNQFSLDEAGGVVRIVTTVNPYSVQPTEPGVWVGEDPAEQTPSTNALYTLDSDLKPLGSVEDLAPGERVYSVRFMGDIAYFVTFRQVDPLFSVSLADPKNPKVLGKLKIPGFSSYLHGWDEGLLFGLGRDADEKTGQVGNIKLSMFDNSDPANVTEKHTLIIKDTQYSEALDNHKAVLIDTEKGIIGFAATFGQQKGDTYKEIATYQLWSYDAAKGFTRIASIPLSKTHSQNQWVMPSRGLYCGDFFYVANGAAVGAYKPTAYKRTGLDKLPKPYYDYGYGIGGVEPDFAPSSGSAGDDVVIDSGDAGVSSDVQGEVMPLEAP